MQRKEIVRRALVHLIQTDCREMYICYIHRTVIVCITLFNRNNCCFMGFFLFVCFFITAVWKKKSWFWIIIKSHCHVHLSVIVLVSARVLLSGRVSTNTRLYLLSRRCTMDDSSWSTLTPSSGCPSLSVTMEETASCTTLETQPTPSTTSGWEYLCDLMSLTCFCFICERFDWGNSILFETYFVDALPFILLVNNRPPSKIFSDLVLSH